MSITPGDIPPDPLHPTSKNNFQPQKQNWLTGLLQRFLGTAPGDVIAAEMGANAHNIVVGKNIVQIGALKIPIWVLFVVTAATIIGISIAIFNALFTGRLVGKIGAVVLAVPTPTSTATPPPTRTPAVMPAGSFNIAVAEFITRDQDGAEWQSAEAQERANSIALFLQSQIDTFSHLLPWQIVVWGPDDHALFIPTGEEAQHARALNADILIYGILHQLVGSRRAIEPKFYLDERPFALASELGEEHALGTKLDYQQESLTSKGDVNKTLEIRIKALAQMLLGFSYLYDGTQKSYESATAQFEDIAYHSEWAKLEDGTGQEILHLFLGNAYMSQANVTEDDSPERLVLLEKSRGAFEKALELNPDYSRLYNGLGSALFQLARTLDDEEDHCSMIDKAKKAYETALAAPSEQKPLSGQVDLRAHFGLGRVQFLRGYCVDGEAYQFGPEWQSADNHYQFVIAEFAKIESPVPSVVDMAGVAYADLGYMTFEQTLELYRRNPDEVDPILEQLQHAVDYFEKSISLLQRSSTDEGRRQLIMVMPKYLDSLCINERGATAQAALNALLANLANTGFTTQEVNDLRNQFIDEMEITNWEECTNVS